MLTVVLVIVFALFLEVQCSVNPELDVLNSVLERMNSLEAKVNSQRDENEQLKAMIIKLQSEVDSLNSENKQLWHRVSLLETREKSREELQHQGIRETENSLGPADEEQNNVERSSLLSGNQLKRLQRRENEMSVAFFATLGHNLQHLGVNQNIVFEKVITNHGNGYNFHAGDFRAPVAGTYVFSVTVTAYGSPIGHYSIFKGGSRVGNLYLRGQEAPYTSSSMTTVLDLAQGDDVAIKNMDQNETLWGSGLEVIKLSLETSLKSQASDWLKWRPVAISANQMLEI